MKNVNKRFYRRILAIMLVVLLVLPQSLSSIRSKAADSVTASWSGSNLNVVYPDSVNTSAVVSAKVDYNGKTVYNTEGNISSFSIPDRIREGVTFTFTLYKASAEEGGEPEVLENGLSWVSDSKNFDLPEWDITTNCNSDSKKITISTSGNSVYLKDYATKAIAYKGSDKIGEVSFADESTSAELSYDDTGKVGRVITVKYFDGDTEINGHDNQITLSWKAGDFVATWGTDTNSNPTITIASSATNNNGSLNDLSGNFVIKKNDSEVARFAAPTASYTLNSVPLDIGDILTVELVSDSASADVLTSESYTVNNKNYYHVVISGDSDKVDLCSEAGQVLAGEDGEYFILKKDVTSYGKVALISEKDQLISEINDSPVTDSSKASFNEDDGTSKYILGNLNSDIEIKVGIIDGTKVLEGFLGEGTGAGQIYPCVKYDYNIKSLPSYVSPSLRVTRGSYDYEKYEVTGGKFILTSEDDFTNGQSFTVAYSIGEYKLASKVVIVKVNDISEVLKKIDQDSFIPDDNYNDFKYCSIEGSKYVINHPSEVKFSFENTEYTQYKWASDDSWKDIPNDHFVIGKVEEKGANVLEVRSLGNAEYGKGSITIILDTTPPEFSEISYVVGDFESTPDKFAEKSSLKKTINYNLIDDYAGVDEKSEYILYVKDKKTSTTGPLSDGKGNISLGGPIFDENAYIICHLVDKVGNTKDERIKVGKIVALNVDDADPDDNVKKVGNGENTEYYVNSGDTISFIVHGDEGLAESITLEGSEGIRLTKGTDYTVEVLEETDNSGAAQYKVTYTNVTNATKDGEYVIKCHAEDEEAGLNTDSKEFTFIIDNTKPTITYNDLLDKNFINSTDVPEGKGLVSINDINDTNLKTIDATVKYIGESGEEKEDVAKNIKNDLETVDEGIFNKTDYVLDKEGTYTISLTVTDKAGNQSEPFKKSFTFDNTKPSTNGIRIEKTTPKGQETKNYNNYQVFDSRVKVTIETKDVISGLKPFDSDASKSGIVVTADEVDKYGESSNIKYENTEKSDKYASVFVFYVNPNYRGKIAIKLTDYAGNVLQKELAKDSENGWVGAISDSLAADITVSTPNAKKIFNNVAYYNASDVARVKIVAIDNISGLNKIRLTNVAADSVNDIPNIGTKFDVSYPSGNITTDEQTINKDFTTDGAYQIKVVATDNAGNEIEDTSSKFIVDTKDPVLTVSYSSSEEFNNTSVSSDIKIDELNLDGASSKITIYRNEAVYKTVSNLEAANKVSFDEDGDYYIVVDAVDKAGNSSTYNGKQEGKIFTVDKTAPKLTLTYNNNNVQNGKYYNAERTGTLTVVEHNFEAQGITITVNGSQVSAGFSNNGGDSYSANIPFNEENDYTLTITGVDKAGNHEEASISDEFTVDLTDPEITIANVEEDALYSGTVNPSIEVTDRYYDNTGTKITLATSRNSSTGKGIEGSYTASTIANGERFVYSNFKNDEANDDYYLLKVVATDLSGRSSEKTIGFMVNRFGSYFTLDDYTAALVDKKYTNLEGDDDIVIAAHNLAKIDESTVYFTVGEDTEVLKENEGYKVDTKAGDDHWNVSTYRFEKSLFESEGEYNIVVSTKDSEGNVADNESKEVPVTFVIDRTAPEYIVNGIENEQNYEDQDKVSGAIELHDNIGVAKAVVDIDGTKSTYEGKELDEMNNSIPVEFGKGSHTVKIKVYDLAGNESKDDDGITFSVAQNAAERAIEGAVKNFWWIFVIIGALAVGGIIFFVVAKRRKEEQ